MSTPPETNDAALRRALVALKDLKARVDHAEHAAHEPIAVIGAGCRLPGGVESPEDYWRLLRDRGDAVGRVPATRWDHDRYYDPTSDEPDLICTDQGGFVDWAIDGFDAPFFGISPREANSLDPQQRLLLEVAWETFEHGGVPADGLAGSLTSVFVGLGTTDYSSLQLRAGDDVEIGTYYGTGVSPAVAAGRISYSLGLRGPAVTLDTACSSSLVAVALAVQSLRSGTSSMALAGGVNLILEPQAMVFLSQFKALSPTGRCHTFSADADGYVRGEGCALVLLKRLSDAQADGDRIMAVIRGVATNHDGHSSGLTVPNGAAQRAVITSALADAGLAPADVDAIEAHGTGTELGDPIEVRALDAVYSVDRPADRPLRLGSVKTNIGHLEAAAGIAGLLKLVLALQHEELPAQLHCAVPSPHIEWASMPIDLLRDPAAWPHADRPRRAGVSAFGFSGTNAHVIVEEAPTRPPSTAGVASPWPPLLTLSARSGGALQDLAHRYADRLERDPEAFGDLAAISNRGRARFARRVAVTATTPGDAAARLRVAVADDGRAPPAPTVPRPRIAFVFTGQGAQYEAMARRLYDEAPVFRSAMDACDRALAPHLPVRLLDVLYGDDEARRRDVHHTSYTQPAMFAIEYSLAAQWRAWGIEPAVVVGHSIGEYAAACVAGVLTLDDAAALIAARGRLMGDLPDGGAMTAVFAEEAAVRSVIAADRDRVSIAAVNGRGSVVVSGERDAVAAAVATLAEQGSQHRPLQVSHAFHSPLMDPMVPAFADVVEGVALLPPTVPFVSSVSGALDDGAVTTSGYWRQHVTATVRFGDAIDAVGAMGIDHFLEIGPQPTLLGLVGRARPDAGLHPSLRQGHDDLEQMIASLGALWTAGVEPDWTALGGPGVGAVVVDAPTYPFQRRRYWVEAPTTARRDRASFIHPLVHARIESPAISGHVYGADVAGDDPAYLGDHRIFDVPSMPATGYLEMAIVAARDAFGDGIGLRQISFHEMLVLPAGVVRSLQVVLGEPADGVAPFAVHGQVDGGGWTRHASGTIDLSPAVSASLPLDVDAQRSAVIGTEPSSAYYERLTTSGIDYGPSFHTIDEVRWGPGWALGHLVLPPTATPGAARHVVHPALLDGCLQLLAAALMDRVDDGDWVYIPVGITSYDAPRPAGAEAWAMARVTSPEGAPVLAADIDLFDAAGQPVATLRGLKASRVDRSIVEEQARRAVGAAERSDGRDDWFHEVTWALLGPAAEAPAAGPSGRTWILVADRGGVADAVGLELAGRGEQRVVVRDADGLEAALGELRGRSLGVLFAAGLDASIVDEGPAATDHAVGRLLAVAQSLLAAERAPADRHHLVVLTRNAQSVNGQFDPVEVAQAPLWGFASSLGAEESSLRLTCLDLPPRAVDVASVVVDELLTDTAEDHVALRSGQRFGARLVPARLDPELTVPPGPFALAVAGRGTFDGIVLEPVAGPGDPAPHEVAIAVRAIGLNFRDVLNVMGMYPGAAGTPGNECAGVVTAIGSAVTSVAVGDEVVAFVDGAFRRFAVAPDSHVFPMPAGLDFAAAATIPIAFLTAEYGLHRLAAMKAGDVVLVHAAAGGVGMAAVQMAHRAGATVIGTAGSEEKRSMLRALGVAHVFDSRSLAFGPQVLDVTGGRGVDIALNSLADEFVGATLDVVAEGGTFLEIGKRGIWTAEQVAAEHPSLGYHVYDLAAILNDDIDLLGSMMATVDAAVADGSLTALPHRTFPIDHARSAFRHMAMARHVGKVVVTLPPADAQPGDDGAPLPDDASYLITGGLGALGLEAAGSLVARGARHVALMSRRPPTEEAVRSIEALRERGASVTVLPADVAVRADVVAALDTIAETMPPLRGIVHAAGVLDDRLVRNLDVGQVSAVLAPKLAAWTLHELTRDDRLDLFVLYSSSSALLASGGQAGYAAANAFLDALAHHRQAIGLPALSIDWGPWDDAGMTATDDPAARRRWRDSGVQLIGRAAGDAVLGTLLGVSAAQVAVLPIDWHRVVGASGGGPVPPLLERVTRASSPAAVEAATDGSTFAADLAEARPEQRAALVRGAVGAAIVAVLGLGSLDDLEDDRGLSDLGMDSLMAVELSNRLQRLMGVLLDSTIAFEHPTLRLLSAHIAHEVLDVPRREAANGDGHQDERPERIAELQQLSELEAEQTLLEELRRSGY